MLHGIASDCIALAGTFFGQYFVTHTAPGQRKLSHIMHICMLACNMPDAAAAYMPPTDCLWIMALVLITWTLGFSSSNTRFSQASLSSQTFQKALMPRAQ